MYTDVTNGTIVWSCTKTRQTLVDKKGGVASGKWAILDYIDSDAQPCEYHRVDNLYAKNTDYGVQIPEYENVVKDRPPMSSKVEDLTNHIKYAIDVFTSQPNDANLSRLQHIAKTKLLIPPWKVDSESITSFISRIRSAPPLSRWDEYWYIKKLEEKRKRTELRKILSQKTCAVKEIFPILYRRFTKVSRKRARKIHQHHIDDMGEEILDEDMLSLSKSEEMDSASEDDSEDSEARSGDDSDSNSEGGDCNLEDDEGGFDSDRGKEGGYFGEEGF